MPSDYVLFYPNERVDLIDFLDMQTSLRKEARTATRDLLMGNTGLAQRVLKQWFITASGGSSIQVNAGTAIGREDFFDNDGVFFGFNGGAQIVDFVAKPPATYTVYIRFVADPGVSSARVFWDENAQLEDVTNVDTRRVVSWDVRAETVSPGAEWQRIADVVWDGVAINIGDITKRQHMLFEGDEDAGFPHEWGDGVNDRNADRGRYGVGDLYTWIQAIRRQITELAGDNQKWYEDWAYIKQDEFRIDAVTDYWTATQFKVGNLVTSNTDIDGATITLTSTGAFTIFSTGGIVSIDGTTGVGITGGPITISGASVLMAPGADLVLAPNGLTRATRPFRSEHDFEVQGGQLSGDNVSFTATIENMFSIPAACFVVDPDDVAMANLNDVASLARLEADGISDVVRARAHIGALIPNGSVLNNVVVEGHHTDGSAQLTATLIKVADDGTRTVIAGPTTAAAGAGDKTITFSGLAETIAHQTFSYYLKVTLDNNSGSVGGTRLYRAKCSYQQDELYPDPEIAA